MLAILGTALAALSAPLPAPDAKVFTGHTEAVRALAFSPDESLIATGDGAGKIRLWSLTTGELRRTLSGHEQGVTTITFSPDGKTLASGGHDKKVTLWDLSTGKPRCVLTGHRSWVRVVCFSPDGTLLASGGDDQTVRLWDVREQKERFILREKCWGEQAVAFSPDGRTLAMTSLDAAGKLPMVKLWDTAQGKETATLEYFGPIHTVAFGPDGKWLAVGTGPNAAALKKLANPTWADVLKVMREEPGEVRLWDLESRKDQLLFKARKGHITSLTCSPSGKLLAVGTREYYYVNRVPPPGDVWLVDVPSSKSFMPPIKHAGAITRLAFSPSGKWLATASEDKTVRLWDVATLLRQAPEK